MFSIWRWSLFFIKKQTEWSEFKKTAFQNRQSSERLRVKNAFVQFSDDFSLFYI